MDYGPALPPRLVLDQHESSDQYVAPSELPPKEVSYSHKKQSHSRSRQEIDPGSASDQPNVESDEPRIPSTKPKKHSDKSKHKSRSRYVSSSSGEDQSPVARHRSSKPSRAQPSGAVSDQDLPQHDPDPPYYREVAPSDMPSQYAEEVDTFRRILSLPDPRESMPRSSTSVMGLDDEKGRQELRPRGPFSILPLSSVIKDAFDKFKHDFKAANLPEGKYVKPPPSTSKWYRVGQPCFQDKIQELNTDFAKICITPKLSGAPMGKVPLPILKELEHQARQNISTLNFTAAFAKTSSSCNASLEKCQHSIKSTVKKIKSQIQKGANPEKAAKRGYEEVAEYMDFWNKTVLIQHRALTCLSKSLAHILQRELYSMANTGLLRREAEMTLLQPQLGETRRQELRNSSFWAQHFSTRRKVQNGNSRVHQDLPDSRGVGIVDRSVGRLPTHPHPPKLKEIPKVLLQVSGVPVHLPPIRTSHSPPGLYNDCKGRKLMALSRGLRIHQYLDDWLIRSQSQEEAQVNTQVLVDLTQSLGWIINQEKSELKPTRVFSFVGYEYHLDSALVKPTQERWLKLQDLILRLKSKRVLSARCLMSLIGLLASTEKMVPEGRLHMRPFQFHLMEHWRYPQSLDNLLPWTESIAAHLDWWQNPSNVMKGADLHPKDHSIQLFTDASNEGWGAHLDQNSTKGLWSDREKKLHINVLELKAVSLAL